MQPESVVEGILWVTCQPHRKKSSQKNSSRRHNSQDPIRLGDTEHLLSVKETLWKLRILVFKFEEGTFFALQSIFFASRQQMRSVQSFKHANDETLVYHVEITTHVNHSVPLHL